MHQPEEEDVSFSMFFCPRYRLLLTVAFCLSFFLGPEFSGWVCRLHSSLFGG